MNNKITYKIGMLDSGIGGLNVLEEVKRLLPNENILYFKDSNNNPYGNKTDEELKVILSNIVDYLISNGVREIIVACNTATTRCIKYLREKYSNIIFIGTEPAIKVATDNNYQNILVLATPATSTSSRLHELITTNKKENENIYIQACEGLANAIENHNEELTDKILKNYLTPYRNKNIDAVVLGCTHYCYIKDNIKKYLSNTKIIDGNLGVSLEAKRKLEQNNLLTNNLDKGIVTIIDKI